MAKTEPLTEQEQQALYQMRRAQEQGLTLKQLAPTMGLEVHKLYQLINSEGFWCAKERSARSHGAKCASPAR